VFRVPPAGHPGKEMEVIELYYSFQQLILWQNHSIVSLENTTAAYLLNTPVKQSCHELA
jgi:hypothetical protein